MDASHHHAVMVENAISSMWTASADSLSVALDELYSSLRRAVAAQGTEMTCSIGNSFIRREMMGSSLTGFLVRFIDNQPEHVADVASKCLTLITADTVACGVSPGKAKVVEIFHEGLSFKIGLGDFEDDWTGGRVWPGAVYLSRQLISHEFDVRGEHVLDLGSGLGVVGIASVHGGARSITFTDWKQSFLDMCITNLSNNLPPDLITPADSTSMLLDWSCFNAATDDVFKNWQNSHTEFTVVGAEIVYDDSHPDWIINVLSQLFSRGAARGLIVVMLNPSRNGVDEFSRKLTTDKTLPFIAHIATDRDDATGQIAAYIHLHKL